MLIVPELEIVLITPPRTGSTALREAVVSRYPASMKLYRHMEADGVPLGYDRWRRICVIREPAARLFSLYSYLRDGAGAAESAGRPDHEARHAAWEAKFGLAAKADFPTWLETEREVFTDPYDSDGGLRFWPRYSVRHVLPETRKSQFYYARPDLGTEVCPTHELGRLAAQLDLGELPRRNEAASLVAGATGRYAWALGLDLDQRQRVNRWLRTWHDWDAAQFPA